MLTINKNLVPYKKFSKNFSAVTSPLDGILLKSLKSETLGWQNFRMPGKGLFHLQLKYTSYILFVKFLQVKKALSL